MKLALLIISVLLAQGVSSGREPGLIETSFASEATLSTNEIEEVTKLANLHGVDKVAKIRTVRHLSGVTIEVAGAEKVEGRKAVVETLVIHREGGERRARPSESKSIGQFWVESSSRPMLEERTIVQIEDRTFRVELLNGIKPAGAD